MTTLNLKPLFYAATLLAATILGGCGGNENKAHIRLINASQDYNSLDLYVDDNRKAEAVTTDTASGYANVDENTYTIGFAANGATTKLKTFSEKLEKTTHKTYVGYGRKGAFGSLEINEDEGKADSGYAKFLVLNAATDAGDVDVYLTGASEDLANVSPVVSDVASGTTDSDGYVKVSSGTYRLRITAAGDNTDVRLDVPSMTLDSKQVAALVVADTVGGVLANAVLVPQQSDVTVFANSKARLRAVSGVTNNSTVNATASSTALLSASRPNTVGNYQLIDAGSVGISLSVGGTAISVANQTLTAGKDYTYLVWTNSSGTQVSLIEDDNRMPTSSSKLKIRAVNAMSALNGVISFYVDSTTIASDLDLGMASATTELASTGTDSVLEVDNANDATLYSSSSTLSANSVYTMFMFGNTGSVTARLRKER